MRRAWVGLLLAGLLLGGCAQRGASVESQAESMQGPTGWELSVSPRAYLLPRVTLLARRRPDGQYAPAGTATAISRDGYFLTSAHCCDPAPLLLSKRYALPRLRRDLKQVRVVWKDVERDLALIHAQVRSRRWFELAEQPPPDGSAVISGGYSDGKVSLRMAAGRVESSQVEGEVTGVRIDHTCPLRRGNSGGPLSDGQGTLVGVNYLAHGAFFGLGAWTGSAAWISPQRVESLIADDRAQRGR